mgnify:CR=1 FL=1
MMMMKTKKVKLYGEKLRKRDEISKGVTLCYDCHAERHFGKTSNAVRAQIKEYLQSIYS